MSYAYNLLDPTALTAFQKFTVMFDGSGTVIWTAKRWGSAT